MCYEPETMVSLQQPKWRPSVQGEHSCPWPRGTSQASKTVSVSSLLLLLWIQGHCAGIMPLKVSISQEVHSSLLLASKQINETE